MAVITARLRPQTKRRSVMRKGAFVTAAVVGILMAGALSERALAADGGAVFKAKCSACHGAEGQGSAMAPSFQGNKFVADSPATDIADVIKNGRAGDAKKYKQFPLPMPKQNLSDDEVAAVIDYIKSIAKK